MQKISPLLQLLLLLLLLSRSGKGDLALGVVEFMENKALRPHHSCGNTQLRSLTGCLIWV